MEKSFPRIATRLLVLCVMLAALCVLTLFKNVPVHAWGYFDSFYECNDNAYTGTLITCRSDLGYPYDPTESQCRYNAADAFVSCLNQLDYPPIDPDFCDQARSARDSCVNQYSGGGLEMWSAYSACIEASGINQCE